MACNCGKRRLNGTTSVNQTTTTTASTSGNGGNTAASQMATPQPTMRQRLERRRAAQARVNATGNASS